MPLLHDHFETITREQVLLCDIMLSEEAADGEEENEKEEEEGDT